MRRYIVGGILSLAVFAVSCGVTGHATALIIHSGFGAGDAFNTGSFASVGRSFIEGVPVDTDQAATFVVPSETSVFLDTIEIALTLFTGVNELDVLLVGHDATAGPLGAPDESQILESFHLSNALVRDVPGPAGPESIVFIASVAGPLLKAGEQYWLMLSVSDPNTLIQWWAAAEELGPGPTVIAERFNLGPWEVKSASGPGRAFRIQGVPAVVTVSIDIKPGDDANCFNNDGHGVIPVAVLGSAEVEVIQIDPTTVSLAGLGVKAVGKSNKLLAHIEDINHDGFQDLVLQIEDNDGVFQPGTATATLTGALFDGTAITGTDMICIVP